MKNKIIGIYKITNVFNGKFYIGQSVNIKDRYHKHMSDLKYNKHSNRHLQRAYNKYGKDVFIFSVVLYCEVDELTYYEQKIVDLLNPEYNICKKCVNSNAGVKRTKKTRKKISEAHKVENLSEETRKRISDSQKGRRWTEQQREKMSKIKYPTGENHHLFGKHPSEESRKKMSESRTGSGNARFGVVLEEEFKKNLSYLNVGVKNKKNCSSKYVGVSLIKKTNKWQARITYEYMKRKNLGFFNTEIEAAIAYNKAAIEYYGDSAKLNIIEENV